MHIFFQAVALIGSLLIGAANPSVTALGLAALFTVALFTVALVAIAIKLDDMAADIRHSQDSRRYDERQANRAKLDRTARITSRNMAKLLDLGAVMPGTGTKEFATLTYSPAPVLVPGMSDELSLDEIKALDWQALAERGNDSECDENGTCSLTLTWSRVAS